MSGAFGIQAQFIDDVGNHLVHPILSVALELVQQTISSQTIASLQTNITC